MCTRQSTFAILSLSNQKTSDEKDIGQPHEGRIQKQLLNATSTGWVLAEQQIPVQRIQNSGKEHNFNFSLSWKSSAPSNLGILLE